MKEIGEVNCFTSLFYFFRLSDESEMDQATHSEIMGIALEVRGWGICSVTLGQRMRECKLNSLAFSHCVHCGDM